MKRRTFPVEVSVDEQGDIRIEQELKDLNDPDPVITLAPEQVGLVALWLTEAAKESGSIEELGAESVPVSFCGKGPEAESEELRIYNNANGMIILKLNEDTFFEVSPAMAKRMRELLSKAISNAFTEMLKGDGEV